MPLVRYLPLINVTKPFQCREKTADSFGKGTLPGCITNEYVCAADTSGSCTAEFPVDVSLTSAARAALDIRIVPAAFADHGYAERLKGRRR